MSGPLISKPLTFALCACVALGLSCTHRKAVEAPPPPTEATAEAPPAPLQPGPGTTQARPEPSVAPAEHPEGGVASTELPTDLAVLNKAMYIKDPLFDTNSAELRPDAREILAADASWLKAYSTVKILIEGHCDERNTEEYNLALGWRRANAAKAYLVSLGVSAERVATISYGEERPFATCHDESCWSQNRRVHFVITAR